jgi:hypothetical protein
MEEDDNGGCESIIPSLAESKDVEGQVNGKGKGESGVDLTD